MGKSYIPIDIFQFGKIVILVRFLLDLARMGVIHIFECQHGPELLLGAFGKPTSVGKLCCVFIGAK